MARLRGQHAYRQPHQWRHLSHARTAPGASEREPLISARLWLASIVLTAAVTAIAFVAVYFLVLAPSGAASAGLYPATPRAWMQAWTADMLDDPVAVCERLFSPGMAFSYDRHASTCRSSLADLKMVSFRVRRITHTAATATVYGVDVDAERQHHPQGFLFLLQRHDGGWQAIGYRN